MQDTCNIQGTYPREGIDSKAFLICFLKRIPYMLLIGLTGAIIGSGLYLLIAAVNNRTPVYYQETEYYIEFAPGRIEAKDYYNAFTWNDVMKTRLILNKTMEQLGSSYSQESVKEMITADILSDVRYLTITVKGTDASLVEAVSNATEKSLEEFARDKAEFDSITQIEDNGTELLQQPLFTWRAAFLGFLIAFLLAFFRFCIHFGLNETFYTREQIRKELGIPVLGLCYGAQLMMHVLGGKVEKAPVREYGKTEVVVDQASPLFTDVSEKTICWMSHFDYISKAAPDFKIVAHTADCPVAAAENKEKNLYAIQFHPEVLHTQEGTKMLYNFVRSVCGCAGTWRMDHFVENSILEIRKKVGDGKVLLALSGGVDSSVAAGLLSKAIGKQLTCVFVDHGLLRKDEGDEVEQVFGANGQFDLKKRDEEIEKWVKELEIKTKNPNNPATTLSGGNQQRIVLAKWLACNLDVLILNGPTVGVDIGSKHDIHMVLQRLANQGLGVIIISDDLPEVIQNCSRVLVIKNGKIKSEYDTQNVSEQMIIDDMM